MCTCTVQNYGLYVKLVAEFITWCMKEQAGAHSAGRRLSGMLMDKLET